ncbi:MAG: TRAP transporter small permease subunit, partial [Rhodocyclaceae bacterium]|nr:TRAP transporter small permease subunit [Rhodocyclaceae bacterium]
AFIALFAGMLYCNAQVRELRGQVSDLNAAVQAAQRALDPAAADAAAPVAAWQRARSAHAQAAARQQSWLVRTQIAAALLGLALLADAALLPGLVRRRAARELAHPELEQAVKPLPPAPTTRRAAAAAAGMHNRFTDLIDRLSRRIGEYVAYWAVLAVFAYYYEVLARYVFNSPTNWVHESMFLMFGMQYLLCGAYAYLEDQHVRVDVFYARFTPRGKALADLATSLFFFVFVLTMLWTGARFAWDAIGVGEHSFTEWAVEYWPVKLAIPIGAALLALQGLSKLLKDILVLMHAKA